MGQALRNPPMVVGAVYELAVSRDGWEVGTKFSCVGADVRSAFAEFKPVFWNGSREKSGFWVFPWDDMRGPQEDRRG